MKRVLLLLAFVGVFCACTKSGADNANVFGRYELRASYGGLAGFNEKYAPGNGRIFQFKSDSTYLRYADGAVAASGRYSIKFSGTDNGWRYGTIALGTDGYTDAFRIKGDSIIIGTTITDGIASDYVKLK